jgi:predicted metal-dependent hydrolase
VIAASARKTISLRVHQDGRVVIQAPAHMDSRQLDDFMLRKSAWIGRRKDYFQEMRLRHPLKELRNGESFAVLGRHFRLKVAPASGCPRLDGKRLIVPVGTGWPELRSWYGALTHRRVEMLLRRHAPALKVRPGMVRLADQTRRWASCDRDGGIRCNWRLAMMPPSIIEYIVVHELCHLIVRAHSPKFWRILKSVLPNYEIRRDWLRERGPGIAFSTSPV